MGTVDGQRYQGQDLSFIWSCHGFLDACLFSGPEATNSSHPRPWQEPVCHYCTLQGSGCGGQLATSLALLSPR